jgi:regulator of sigma E protease
MYGDEGAASTPDTETLAVMDDEQKRVSFHYKPLWQKALIVAAGPVANFILTIAIMTWFLYTTGVASSAPVIGEVMPDTPAQAAGLKAGDLILSVDGREVKSFSDIPNLIATNLGTPVELVLKRDIDTLTLTITPTSYEDEDALGNKMMRPLIGIRSQQMKVENFSFPAAVWEATKRTYQLCEMSLRFLGQMIMGDRSADELKGPVGIAKMSGQVTQTGDTFGETFRMILWFIAMLSANLGLVNLLPIPMLDGGHLAYYAIEGVRGKPMAQKFQEYGFRLGFGLIICLMVFTLYNDMRQMFF